MTERRHQDGTVGKALDVLDAVAAHGGPVRFSDLLAGSPHPKATLHRLLQTLTRQGMLDHDPDDHVYRLGLRLVRLAHFAWSQASLAPIARPHVEALSALTGETIHLAQLDGGHVLYVDKRNAARPLDMFAQAGRIGPAYCTGVGKAMLAFIAEEALAEALKRQSFHRFTQATITCPEALRKDLAEVRGQGLAFDREEHEPRIICVAAPIVARSRRMLGAVSVTSSTDRHTIADLAAFGPALREAAARIAADAESWLFPDPVRNEAHPEAQSCLA